MATHAETAYVRLSEHLRPPRGPIDVVLSDNYDVSNGYATPFPTNRIVVYANPTITESSLRFVDDPIQLVLTHELVHVFHLDRAGGVWKVLQKIFGRAPYYFPIGYQPSWIKEGLAVYYESLLTGAGRIVGSEHRMLARTAALSHRFPRLDQLSIANPTFPFGHYAYAYGGLFMDYLARAHGDSSMRTFVESSARQLIPWYLRGPSRRAFGSGLTAEYSRWARSLMAGAGPSRPPMPGWRDLTVEGAFANFPRWINDSTIVYSGTSGRESYGAYTLTIGDAVGRWAAGGITLGNDRPGAERVVRERIGRRHTESPNSVLPDGSLLYSQLEYTSPWHLRSDLYVDGPDGETRRLTHGARLSIPDARHDGRIVAVQTIPAGTRLALVSRDGQTITPITTGGPDEQWLEPRWSPDGRHIAAVRWLRGGTSQIVVLDTTGTIVETLVSERTVNATPSWSPDGRVVYFSSDRTGITNLYHAPFLGVQADSATTPAFQRVSDAETGLFEAHRAPSRPALSAVVFRSDGYHVGIAPLVSVRATDAPAIETIAPRTIPTPAPSTATATRYSPWRTLLPRYWMPLWGSALENNSLRLGALTSGEDVIGRHAYDAYLLVPTDNSGLTGAFSYRNTRLGQPTLEVTGRQDWENYRTIRDAAEPNPVLGILRRRERELTLGASFPRPRARTFSVFSVSAGVEIRDYAADSTPLMARVDTVFQRAWYYPQLAATLGWSNTQLPPFAISPEDGVTLSTTGRVRWRSGDTASATVSVVGAASAFKSLDLPGYAHHVLAVRGAGGWVDQRGTSYLEVGGLSGGILDIVPGYALGEGRRTFGVRGFPAGALLGMRAFTANLEYRAPFRIPARGLGMLPLFLGRTSITVFGDAGTAWCPDVFPGRGAPNSSLCTQADLDIGRAPGSPGPPLLFLEPTYIASAGAELNADASLLSWDSPVRWRLGAAVPLVNRDLAGPERWSAYLTVGVSF